jgi:hypothetical protein
VENRIPTSPIAFSLNEKNDDDATQSYEEMKKEYDRKNKSRNIISDKLGERMLAGWTLLGFNY